MSSFKAQFLAQKFVDVKFSFTDPHASSLDDIGAHRAILCSPKGSRTLQALLEEDSQNCPLIQLPVEMDPESFRLCLLIMYDEVDNSEESLSELSFEKFPKVFYCAHWADMPYVTNKLLVFLDQNLSQKHCLSVLWKILDHENLLRAPETTETSTKLKEKCLQIFSDHTQECCEAVLKPGNFFGMTLERCDLRFFHLLYSTLNANDQSHDKLTAEKILDIADHAPTTTPGKRKLLLDLMKEWARQNGWSLTQLAIQIFGWREDPALAQEEFFKFDAWTRNESDNDSDEDSKSSAPTCEKKPFQIDGYNHRLKLKFDNNHFKLSLQSDCFHYVVCETEFGQKKQPDKEVFTAKFSTSLNGCTEHFSDDIHADPIGVFLKVLSSPLTELAVVLLTQNFDAVCTNSTQELQEIPEDVFRFICKLDSLHVNSELSVLHAVLKRAHGQPPSVLESLLSGVRVSQLNLKEVVSLLLKEPQLRASNCFRQQMANALFGMPLNQKTLVPPKPFGPRWGSGGWGREARVQKARLGTVAKIDLQTRKIGVIFDENDDDYPRWIPFHFNLEDSFRVTFNPEAAKVPSPEEPRNGLQAPPKWHVMDYLQLVLETRDESNHEAKNCDGKAVPHQKSKETDESKEIGPNPTAKDASHQGTSQEAGPAEARRAADADPPLTPDPDLPDLHRASSSSSSSSSPSVKP